MSESLPIVLPCAKDELAAAHLWLAQVLVSFAQAEQEIGHLCMRIGLPINAGPLGSIKPLLYRLSRSQDRRCANLVKRIERWQSLRPVRHVLAHATVRVLYDENRKPVIVTRHLPRDADDVTPDRVWQNQECTDILRIAASDGRSISDQVRNLMGDKAIIAQLCQP